MLRREPLFHDSFWLFFLSINYFDFRQRRLVEASIMDGITYENIPRDFWLELTIDEIVSSHVTAVDIVS